MNILIVNKQEKYEWNKIKEPRISLDGCQFLFYLIPTIFFKLNKNRIYFLKCLDASLRQSAGCFLTKQNNAKYFLMTFYYYHL